MKYVLGLSFYFKSYQDRKAILRIFADNRLVDELCLDQDINPRTIKTQASPGREDLHSEIPYRKLEMYDKIKTRAMHRARNKLIEYKSINNLKNTTEELLGSDVFSSNFDIANSANEKGSARERSYTLPERLFLFEIDEKYLNKKITIECVNHNNNFTNGFMTETSYYKFYDIFLIPKSFFHRGKIKNILSRLFKNGTMESITRTDVQSNNTWPGAKKVTYLGDSHDLTETVGSIWHVTLGGHFSLELDVIKKHKISMLSDRQDSKGIYFIPHETICNFVFFDLINRVNEDQRSSI